MYLLVGCNLERSHGVIGSCVRRGVQQRGARLVSINPVETWLADRTDVYMNVARGKDHLVLAAILKYLIDDGVNVDLPEELVERVRKLDHDDVRYGAGVPSELIREAASLYRTAKRPIVVCGRGVTRQGPEPLAAAFNLVKATGHQTPTGRWRLVELALGANSAGAGLLGPSPLDIDELDPHTAKLAFVVLGDDDPVWPADWLNKLRTVTYVVALVAREHEVLDVSHALVPTPAWAERSGPYVNFEGRVQRGRGTHAAARWAVLTRPTFRHADQDLARAQLSVEAARLPDAVRFVAEAFVPVGPLEAELDPTSLEALAGE